MNRKITIAVKNPGEPWEKRIVEDVLSVYQQIVGGYIEGAYTTSFGVHVFCNEEGRLTEAREVHLLNTESPIPCSVDGICTDTSPAQPLNASAPIVLRPEEAVRVVMKLQFVKHWSLIASTPEGMTRLVTSEPPANRCPPPEKSPSKGCPLTPISTEHQDFRSDTDSLVRVPQRVKAPEPIALRLEGSDILSILEQESNAFIPIDVKPSGRTMDLSAIQLANAQLPIVSMPAGRSRPVSWLQYWNAPSPIALTAPCRLNDLTPVQPQNELAGTDVHQEGTATSVISLPSA